MNSDRGDPKLRDNVIFGEYITKLRLFIKSIDELLIAKELEFTAHLSSVENLILDINNSVDDCIGHYNIIKAEYTQHFKITKVINNENIVKHIASNENAFKDINYKIFPIKECFVDVVRLEAEKYKKYFHLYEESKNNGFGNPKTRNRKLFTTIKNKDNLKNKKIIELLDKDDTVIDDTKGVEVNEEDENFQEFLSTQIQSSLESQTTEIETDLIAYLIDEDDEIKISDVSLADQDKTLNPSWKSYQEVDTKYKRSKSYLSNASKTKRRRRVISSPSDDDSTHSTPSSTTTTDGDLTDSPSTSCPNTRRQRSMQQHRRHSSPHRKRHSQRIANLAPQVATRIRSFSSSSDPDNDAPSCSNARRSRAGPPSKFVPSDASSSPPPPLDPISEAISSPHPGAFKRVCLVADIGGDEERVAAKLGDIYGADLASSTPPTPQDGERADDDTRGEAGKEGGAEDGKDDKRVKSRKNIRKIKESADLAQETRDAAKAERERLLRIKENRRIKMNLLNEATSDANHAITELILESPVEGNGIRLEVDAAIVKHLKPHQVKGITFLYENLIESWARFQEGDSGGGAILAHLMGLGKTLQVITLVHTLLTSPHFGERVRTCLVICPQNTCMNWMAEIEKWTREAATPIKYWALHYAKRRKARNAILTDWRESGGLLVVGYDMFRLLVANSKSPSNGANKRNGSYLATLYESLQDPGPDILVCDEGHMLKNSSTAIFKAVNSVKTKRRIVLTGTPLQNNLYEYHCMVQLVRENILGSRFEFQNAFVNPIKNGQCADSTEQDVKIMKKRAHILHQKLAGCVQRMDYSSLTTPLTTKYEYVILVRLSPKQAQMYKHYLDLLKVAPTSQDVHSAGAPNTNNNNKFSVFVDFTNLYSIITHPWLCHMNEEKRERIRNSKLISSDEDSFLDDGDRSEPSTLESESDDSDRDSIVELLGDKSEDGEEASTSFGPRNKRVLRSDLANRKNDCPTRTPKNVRADQDSSKWVSGDKDFPGEDQDLEVAPHKNMQNDPEDPTPPGNRNNSWWKSFLGDADANNVWLSGKIIMVLEILKEAEAIGDKVLLFSQSLNTLDYLEEVLANVDKHATKDIPHPIQVEGDPSEQQPNNSEAEHGPSHEILTQGWTFGTWNRGVDYFRMDGSTPITTRHRCTEIFNDVSDIRARFFLISTRAGSLGVNLIGASRVIIMDACWNPSHDTQSIFRAYRLGQDKPVFIYRLISQGTIEERIYERQVTKQSLSQRVVDKKQIERHFTFEDLDKLYDFDPRVFQADNVTGSPSTHTTPTASAPPSRDFDRPPKHYPLPNVPKDHLLAQLLLRHGSWIVTYHDHDSLLENKVSEELTEEERRLAWEEYENERRYGIGMAGSSAAALIATGSSFAGQPLPPPTLGSYMQRFAHLARASSTSNPLNSGPFQLPQSGSGITLGHPEFRVCGILIKDLMEMLHLNGRLNAEAIYKYILAREGTEDMVKFKDHVTQLMTTLKDNQTLIQNMVSYARTLESLKNPCPVVTAPEVPIPRPSTQTRLPFPTHTVASTPLTHPLFPITGHRNRQVGYRQPGPKQVMPSFSSGTTTTSYNNISNNMPYPFHQNIQRHPTPFGANDGSFNGGLARFTYHNGTGCYNPNLTTSSTRPPGLYNLAPGTSLFRAPSDSTQAASTKMASRGFRIIDGKAYPI